MKLDGQHKKLRAYPTGVLTFQISEISLYNITIGTCNYDWEWEFKFPDMILNG